MQNNWILIALLPPILFSATIYLDKFVVDKYFRGAGGLTIYSGLVKLLMAAVIFLLPFSKVTLLPWRDGLLIILGGALLLYYILPYFKAISLRDASQVTPLFQVGPAMSLILSFLLLRETIHGVQYLGMILIIFGALTISAVSLKRLFKPDRVLFYMLLSTLGFNLAIVLFKFVYLSSSFWTVLFYQNIGGALAGASLLALPKYRKEFTGLIKSVGVKVGALMFLSGGVDRVAESLYNLATTLVAVPLVSMVTATQPFFIVLYGTLLTIFFPKLIREDISLNKMLRKLVSVVIMFLGVLLVSR